MGFVQRAFTPPGTGGAEAAGITAQAVAQQTILAQQVEAQRQAALNKMPDAPQAPKPPSAPPQFTPGSGPGAKDAIARQTGTALGRTAAVGQTARKVSVLGG